MWILPKTLVVLAAVLLAVTACGRRGDLEPPGGLPEREATPASLIGAISRDDPAPARTGEADKPFVLDPLI